MNLFQESGVYDEKSSVNRLLADNTQSQQKYHRGRSPIRGEWESWHESQRKTDFHTHAHECAHTHTGAINSVEKPGVANEH